MALSQPRQIADEASSNNSGTQDNLRSSNALKSLLMNTIVVWPPMNALGFFKQKGMISTMTNPAFQG